MNESYNFYSFRYSIFIFFFCVALSITSQRTVSSTYYE